MSDVGYVAGVLLAVVFAWAGVAKLRAPAATAITFRGLRLPAPRVLARVVPVVELGLAAALVAAPVVGGVLALGLLAVFTGLLAARLRAGETVSCGCFGSARTDPLSPADLVRNALLAGLAAGALLAGGARLPDLPAVIAASAVFVVGLLVLALVEVRLTTGRLLDVTLETGPEAAA